MLDFSTNLERLRKERGMTYKALADAAGVDQMTCWHACHGRAVKITTAQKLAHSLGVGLADLVASDDPHRPAKTVQLVG
jgi:transcriptional regulator with XRE-family HTH domain